MKKLLIASALMASAAHVASSSAPQTETLDRGVVAVKGLGGGVFVSWRSLESDPEGMTFNLYRNGTLVNDEPIAAGTNYTDPKGSTNARYVVKCVVDGQETETSAEAVASYDIFKRIRLDRPAGGKTPDGVEYTYSPNDCSVGDVDGDGQYEIFVKWDPSNSHDNSEGGYTGDVYIDCYTLAGEKLWRVDLGRNIRAGAHYTQFMVYDFDGDGSAEMACKTAPGTVDGQGNAVLMGSDKVTDDYRSSKSGVSKGQVISGPEYLTVFSGRTGAALSTVAYEPGRSVRTSSQWGDSYGGRSERYLACVAYLDGVRPSLVMCRGYYTAAYLCAWDFRDGQLTRRWLHKSETAGKGAYGEGAHSVTVGDVDGDGKDEIVYGSACIDDDGSLLYRTGFGHGDALHLGDFDPERPGLEVFMPHEESKKVWDCELRDAATGEVIWGVKNSGNDIGRGIVADVSSRWPGHEMWPGSRFKDGARADCTFDCKGNEVASSRGSSNFRIYWDGDLLDELFDGGYDKDTGKSNPTVTKRNEAADGNAGSWAFGYLNAESCNTTKATPCLQADIFGDWREELILWSSTNSSDIFIFTTNIPTPYRIPCLMQDHQYRMAVAWQNCGYNQPPHLSYNLYDRYNMDPVLTVESGTLNQSVELHYPVTPITGSWTNARTVRASGLPEGVELYVDETSSTFTLSGTPQGEGRFDFTLTTEGGITDKSVSGTITVTAGAPLEKLAWFPFEEAGDTHPNLVSGAARAFGSPALTEGVVGNAVRFDGTSDYLLQEAYPALQLGNGDFTIEMWFRSTDDAAYLLHKGSMAADEAAGTTGCWVGVEFKNGDLKFAVDDNVVKSEAKVGASSYFNGEWTHAAFVREAASRTLRIYLNGKQVAEATDQTGSISDNMEPLVIGNVNVSFNNLFRGDMDELTLFSGAMSASRIAEHYESRGTSGVEMLPAAGEASGAPVEYFSLQGFPVTHPRKGGLYIRRQGGVVGKVIF